MLEGSDKNQKGTPSRAAAAMTLSTTTTSSGNAGKTSNKARTAASRKRTANKAMAREIVSSVLDSVDDKVGRQQPNVTSSSRPLTGTVAGSINAPPESNNTNASHTTSSAKPCRYGSNCRRKETCKFTHPPPQSLDAAAATGTTGKNNTANATSRSCIPCRYGIRCLSSDCTFSHPAEWNPSDNRNKNSSNISKSNKGEDKSSQNNVKMGTPPKLNELHPGCYCGPLRPADAKGYKAAGILLLRQRRHVQTSPTNYFEATSPSSTTSADSSSSNKVQVLLCAEVRKKKKHKDSPQKQGGGNKNNATTTMELNLLGGKIEQEDGQDARATAAREFWEETGGCQPVSECQRLVGINTTTHESDGEENCDVDASDNNVTTIWCGPGKYALYIMQDCDTHQQQQWDAMPFRYWETIQSGEPLPSGAEADHLVWMDWDLIVRQCRPTSYSKHKQDSSPISFRVPAPLSDEETSPDSLPTQGASRVTLQFSFFTASILGDKTLQNGVKSIIQRMDLKSAGGPKTADLQEVSASLAGIQIGEANKKAQTIEGASR